MTEKFDLYIRANDVQVLLRDCAFMFGGDEKGVVEGYATLIAASEIARCVLRDTFRAGSIRHIRERAVFVGQKMYCEGVEADSTLN